MIFEHVNYRSYLRATLAERMDKNPGYSLRAMAKQLGIAPSSLSHVIKGRKNLSPGRAMRLAEKLSLGPQEAQYLCLLVQADSEKNPLLKEVLLQRLNDMRPSSSALLKFNDLSVDQFKLISDWYHYPILELTKLQGDDFKFTPKEISKRLGITPAQAESAVERLERLKLLETSESGKYRIAGRNVVIASAPNQAFQRYHRQMLAMAADALESQGTDERVGGSETLAIHRAQVPEAQKLIHECLEKIALLTTDSRAKSDVYHLEIQFFNLTRSPISRNKE